MQPIVKNNTSSVCVCVCVCVCVPVCMCMFVWNIWFLNNFKGRNNVLLNLNLKVYAAVTK